MQHLREERQRQINELKLAIIGIRKVGVRELGRKGKLSEGYDFSKTDIIFAIKDIRIPKALIDNPVTSKAFIFNKVTEKYKKITTLIA